MRSNRRISSWDKTERFTESRHRDEAVRTQSIDTVWKSKGYTGCFKGANFDGLSPDRLVRGIIWITLIEHGGAIVEAFTNPVVALKRTVVTSKVAR